MPCARGRMNPSSISGSALWYGYRPARCSSRKVSRRREEPVRGLRYKTQNSLSPRASLVARTSSPPQIRRLRVQKSIYPPASPPPPAQIDSPQFSVVLPSPMQSSASTLVPQTALLVGPAPSGRQQTIPVSLPSMRLLFSWLADLSNVPLESGMPGENGELRLRAIRRSSVHFVRFIGDPCLFRNPVKFPRLASILRE